MEEKFSIDDVCDIAANACDEICAMVSDDDLPKLDDDIGSAIVSVAQCSTALFVMGMTVGKFVFTDDGGDFPKDELLRFVKRRVSSSLISAIELVGSDYSAEDARGYFGRFKELSDSFTKILLLAEAVDGKVGILAKAVGKPKSEAQAHGERDVSDFLDMLERVKNEKGASDDS